MYKNLAFCAPLLPHYRFNLLSFEHFLLFASVLHYNKIEGYNRTSGDPKVL